jgi:hypothetical protein
MRKIARIAKIAKNRRYLKTLELKQLWQFLPIPAILAISSFAAGDSRLQKNYVPAAPFLCKGGGDGGNVPEAEAISSARMLLFSGSRVMRALLSMIF